MEEEFLTLGQVFEAQRKRRRREKRRAKLLEPSPPPPPQQLPETFYVVSSKRAIEMPRSSNNIRECILNCLQTMVPVPATMCGGALEVTLYDFYFAGNDLRAVCAVRRSDGRAVAFDAEMLCHDGYHLLRMPHPPSSLGDLAVGGRSISKIICAAATAGKWNKALRKWIGRISTDRPLPKPSEAPGFSPLTWAMASAEMLFHEPMLGPVDQECACSCCDRLAEGMMFSDVLACTSTIHPAVTEHVRNGLGEVKKEKEAKKN